MTTRIRISPNELKERYEKKRNGTDIERLNLAIPNHKVPHVWQGSAHEYIVIDSDALGPHGTALLGGFLGVVFQSDGWRFRVLDGRVRLVAAVGPVWRDQRRR